MALLMVPAHDIDTAGLAFEAELPAAWLDAQLADADIQGDGPGRIEARLSRSGDDVVVRGKVRAALRSPCARCLEPARASVEAELSLLLKAAPSLPVPSSAGGKKGKAAPAGPAGKEPEYEFSAEEADVDVFDGETVVLDPFVREAILLEVPNFPLCSDECAGIALPRAEEPEPPEEGAPLDPRLAPLGALRSKLAAKDAKANGAKPGAGGEEKRKKS